MASFRQSGGDSQMLASQFELGSFQWRSRCPACMKMRRGLRRTTGIRSKYGLPPGICAKLEL